MANTSTIKSLDGLIIKAISAISKSKKHPGNTSIYDSTKIFLENCDINDSLFWERMKYLKENETIYKKPTKTWKLFLHFKRRLRNCFFSLDQTHVINS